MSRNEVTIWSNAAFPQEAFQRLIEGTKPNRLLLAQRTSALNLVTSPPDPQLAMAQVVFGQPDVAQWMELDNIRWVHLTSAGYTAYDRDDLRQLMRSRGAILTTSSGVYDEPCAQHVLAMMMAFARQLLPSFETQRSDRSWPAAVRREKSFLLNGQTAVLCGYGEIAKRLSELLAPFRMKLIGIRRSPKGDELIPTYPIAELDRVLSRADHVINILPANDDSHQFFDRARLDKIQSGAFFYNIGRGSTVDQQALADALQGGRLSGAYLDVMTPEPLPSDHFLWTLPNCYITPHTAGGFAEEMSRLVDHFLDNFQRYTSGQPLLNRVI